MSIQVASLSMGETALADMLVMVMKILVQNPEHAKVLREAIDHHASAYAVSGENPAGFVVFDHIRKQVPALRGDE
ncbi:hypothetical protein [Methylobacterium sp. WCS2018Hpa-22]|uniref:hypothetical protein n=1 Tax=Methylobacterium sp. WCS2018Hpa-22 TaxID=3073633 RepID=UPI0028895DDD|nr:hypothetical protein [Methylobacterium sp. WCS2018Hpa-22]